MSISYVPNPHVALIEMPLGIHVVERRYSPQESASDSSYKQDAAYFKARKDRWITIRRATPTEFDNLEATFWLAGELVQPPTAWVRVTRHPTLGFRVVLVWRGSLVNVSVDEHGYLALESDDAVDFILQAMATQGCANWPEINDYFLKLERARAIHKTSHAVASNGKVH